MHSRKARSRPNPGPTRDPTVRFAVVGNPRTGSSHLVSLLDSHPDVACWDDEIFDVGEAFDKSGYCDPQEFLNSCVFAVNSAAVGFKLLWDALDRFKNMWALLRDMNIRIVHTYRANVLDSFISFQLATINKAFTSWHGDYKTLQFQADFDTCLEWFKLTEDRDREIQRRSFQERVPRLSIEYNELCLSQDNVLDFLNVARQPLTTRLKKQRTGRQSQILSNYLQLKKEFAGSPWIQYFED